MNGVVLDETCLECSPNGISWLTYPELTEIDHRSVLVNLCMCMLSPWILMTASMTQVVKSFFARPAWTFRREDLIQCL